ncbi:hypothetical protein DFH09DRAFT_1367493 [Mycena vulgaris]|nr:hypothetical protein DFH09DRAFT_1367493 [Mycena vulgaris]
MACRATYASFAKQLVHENLVTQEQLSRYESIFSLRDSIFPYSTLFRLDSTFLVNFSRKVGLTVVGETLHPVNLPNLFAEYRKRVAILPWTGSAVARFEASTLPQHAERRVLHLRIVKTLQPVACSMAGYEGRVVRPEEGHLFTVRFYGRPPEPWAYNIDRKSNVAAALRVLWDNPRTP